MLKLMYITNSPDVAKIAQESGTDIIFIDLEIIGKYKRQGHLDTVISCHKIDDINKVKPVLKEADLLVRINPIHQGSENEIDLVCQCGADIIMLPYFKKKSEVKTFVKLVNRRAKACILVETPEAVENIDDILSVGGIDMVHIGLNDLHLGYGMRFMFELLANDTVERLCEKFAAKGIPYGFGGIARPGLGELPAEYIIAEHYRLGSSIAILSRSFCNANNQKKLDNMAKIFKEGVHEIREYEHALCKKHPSFFEENKLELSRIVSGIVGVKKRA